MGADMKTRSINGLVVLAAILLVLGVGAAGIVLLTKPAAPTMPISESSNAPKQLAVGRPAPDFTLNTLDGKPVALKELRGKKVLVNFWASWCPPCIEETPELKAAYKALQANEGAAQVAFVGIGYQDKLENLQKFVQDNAIEYTTVEDPDGKVGDAYLVLGMPVSVFIDSTGTVQKVKVGTLKQAEIIQAFGAMQ